jgi:uncharacterized protein (TIGR03086 family)
MQHCGMTLTSDTVFLRGLDVFGGAVARLSADDWDRPSPCAGWTARDVLGHVGSGVRFGTALLAGQQPQWNPTERPADEVEGDPQQWWRSVTEGSADAVASADLDKEVDSPMGRRTIAAGLSFPAVDLFVHAWDVSRVVGADVDIPTDVIEFAHSVLDRIPEDQLRSERTFGPPQASPPGASPSQEFLAWTGRDVDWTPPTG